MSACHTSSGRRLDAPTTPGADVATRPEGTTVHTPDPPLGASLERIGPCTDQPCNMKEPGALPLIPGLIPRPPACGSGAAHDATSLPGALVGRAGQRRQPLRSHQLDEATNVLIHAPRIVDVFDVDPVHGEDAAVAKQVVARAVTRPPAIVRRTVDFDRSDPSPVGDRGDRAETSGPALESAPARRFRACRLGRTCLAFGAALRTPASRRVDRSAACRVMTATSSRALSRPRGVGDSAGPVRAGR